MTNCTDGILDPQQTIEPKKNILSKPSWTMSQRYPVCPAMLSALLITGICYAAGLGAGVPCSPWCGPLFTFVYLRTGGLPQTRQACYPGCGGSVGLVFLLLQFII